MKFDSIGEITEKIIELEKKHDLLNLTVNNVKIYQVVRYLIYIDAIDSNIDKKSSGSKLNISTLKKIYKKLSRVNNFFFYNPFLEKKKADALLFESGRKQKINGKFFDPFTAQIRNSLEKSKVNFTIYQSSYFFDNLSEKSSNTRHLDYIILMSSFKSKLHHTEIAQEDTEIVKELGKIIQVALNLKLDFYNLVTYQLSLFVALSKYYSKILDTKNPEKIYLVNFCDKSALISECKKRKIQVIDMQHGFISSKDIIYHYPNSIENKIDYFPDKFLAWPEIWRGGCTIPLSKDNIEIINNYALESEVKKYKDVEKKQNKIVVISQDTLTSKILDEIFILLEANPDHLFYYKPHPNEYTYINSMSKYSELINKKNFFTVNITDNLYSHFSDAESVVGVYSSSLIEALAFKCKLYILDLPGSEMMSALISEGKAKLLTDAKL